MALEAVNLVLPMFFYDAIAKMNDYKHFNNTDDEEAKKEFVRADVIKYIVDTSKQEILIKKATTEGEIDDDCEQEKS